MGTTNFRLVLITPNFSGTTVAEFLSDPKKLKRGRFVDAALVLIAILSTNSFAYVLELSSQVKWDHYWAQCYKIYFR